MKCDKDCFHCKFSDCQNQYGPFTEEKDINGALTKWEHSAQLKAINSLACSGYNDSEIAEILGLPYTKIRSMKTKQYQKKKAAKLCRA